MLTHPTALADWLAVAPLLLCLAGAALLLVLGGHARAQGWAAFAIVAVVTIGDGALFRRVLDLGPVSMTMGKWLPPFGISFTADPLGAGLATISAVVTAAVVLALLLDAGERAARQGLYPLVLMLLAGVTGAFLTGDLFNLYVWFEVMLIASFGLVVLRGEPLQLDAAVKYAVPNMIATILFLAALGLLYGTLGTLNMADIVGAARRTDPGLLSAIAGLFVLAFGIKAAVFPVNAWLPASYHAPPAAISALLGALLTKVGLYAALRLLLMLLPEARMTLSTTLLAVAALTAVIGPLSALAETNLRRAIGFLLIGGVGVAFLALADGNLAVSSGAALYIVHAMLSFGAFYLLAGVIEGATGAADTRRMGGLHTASSWLSMLFFLTLLSVAGVPPLLGFWPKLLLLDGFLISGDWTAVAALLLNGLLTLVATARLWSFIFWRPRMGAAERPYGTAPAALLVGTIVLAGLFPNLLVRAANLAAADLLQPVRYIAAVGLAP